MCYVSRDYDKCTEVDNVILSCMLSQGMMEQRTQIKGEIQMAHNLLLFCSHLYWTEYIKRMYEKTIEKKYI